MLKRLLTAALLIPLVVWGILRLPTPAFVAVSGAFMVLAVWEWTGLIPLRTLPAKLVYLLGCVAVAGGAWSVLQQHPEWLPRLLAVATIWWLLATVWLRAPQIGRDWIAFKFILAVLALLPAWLALGALHGRAERGPELALFIFVLMWVADSGAYFAGKRFGRHKLAPRVSPGKTWEGVAGGMTGSALFAVFAGQKFGWSGDQLLAFVGLALACAAISIVGDLFFSLLKRQQNLKDTGQLFPGHGGILDRIDSLLAAVPVFLFGLNALALL
ncbi:MAG: phosphatidate cytidylyltransferase [Gammaproteobacteria bacterium]|nr:phosphatidate cytidylyltransferase [Gammaproteobacteria bacterium]